MPICHRQLAGQREQAWDEIFMYRRQKTQEEQMRTHSNSQHIGPALAIRRKARDSVPVQGLEQDEMLFSKWNGSSTAALTDCACPVKSLRTFGSVRAKLLRLQHHISTPSWEGYTPELEVLVWELLSCKEISLNGTK
eukprot:1147074-Pelagomonas_calceolata.AAC.2